MYSTQSLIILKRAMLNLDVCTLFAFYFPSFSLTHSLVQTEISSCIPGRGIPISETTQASPRSVQYLTPIKVVYMNFLLFFTRQHSQALAHPLRVRAAPNPEPEKSG